MVLKLWAIVVAGVVTVIPSEHCLPTCLTSDKIWCFLRHLIECLHIICKKIEFLAENYQNFWYISDPKNIIFVCTFSYACSDIMQNVCKLSEKNKNFPRKFKSNYFIRQTLDLSAHFLFTDKTIYRQISTLSDVFWNHIFLRHVCTFSEKNFYFVFVWNHAKSGLFLK